MRPALLGIGDRRDDLGGQSTLGFGAGGTAEFPAFALDEAAHARTRRLDVGAHGERLGVVIGAYHRAGDRVIRVALERSGHTQRLGGLGLPEGDDVGHLGMPAREGTGLVERDRPDLRRCLEECAALHEHAIAACPGDTAHDGHGRRDHQRARTAHDEHHERSVDPLGPTAPVRSRHRGQKRRHHGDRDREGDDRRRVDGAEAVDEPLRGRSRRLRFLDQRHDPRESRVARDRRRCHLEQSGRVEGAGEDLCTGGLLGRHRLTRDRRLVDRARAESDHAVHRHALAGAHDGDLTHARISEGDLDHRAATSDPDGGRRKVHEVADRPARTLERTGLQQPAYREQEEHGRPLTPLAEGGGAEDGDRHEHVHVEHPCLERDKRAAPHQQPAEDDRDRERGIHHELGRAGERKQRPDRRERATAGCRHLGAIAIEPGPLGDRLPGRRILEGLQAVTAALDDAHDRFPRVGGGIVLHEQRAAGEVEIGRQHAVDTSDRRTHGARAVRSIEARDAPCCVANALFEFKPELLHRDRELGLGHARGVELDAHRAAAGVAFDAIDARHGADRLTGAVAAGGAPHGTTPGDGQREGR